ncbi:hypothetical protein E8E14_010419 [Neopestalotiopsis sp. 37M]|nr:hypothetical protein E8E14_010419 [Neopestalotiopsis sp. 37M]
MATTLDVVIVGAGFGGLTAAIECRLRGMRVKLVETYPTSRTQGDVIDFFPNGGRILGQWDNGNLGKKLINVSINQADQLEYYKYDGTWLTNDPWILRPHHYYEQFAGHRGELHQIVSDYASEIGVEMVFGHKVTQYLDQETDGRLGVIIENGDVISGDVVIAADGPRSLARSQILKLPETKVNSGYAIYRAYVTMGEQHRKNLLIAEYTNPHKDLTRIWIAKDLHFIIYSWNKGRDLGWILTHKDDYNIQESWSFPGNKEDVIAYLDEGNFIEQLKEVVRLTPDEQLIDYKLVWRDPLKTWRGQGASQAVEDGVVVAACLEKAKGDVELALKVFERVRYNRSHVLHMLSTQVRDEYHNVDWTAEFCAANPSALCLPRAEWIAEYDPRAEVDREFDRIAQEVRSGKEGTIEELSIPAGGSKLVIDLELSTDSSSSRTSRI